MKLKHAVKIVFLIIVMILCGLLIFTQTKEIKEYTDARSEYHQLRKYVKEESNSEIKKNTIPDNTSKEEDVLPVIDFTQLKAINDDVIGWIYIPTIDLSYPVVKSKDNIEYVTHTFEKTENKAGCIFSDCRIENPFYQKTILYGHNMKDGSMFKKIYDLSQEDLIYIFLPSNYHISYKVEDMRYVYADNEQIYSVDTTTDNETLILSTCAEGDLRFVILAKRTLTEE